MAESSNQYSEKSRVFNTKERCPVVVCILTRRGETMHHHRGGLKDVNLDVAEFLHLQCEIPDTIHAISEDNETSGLRH